MWSSLLENIADGLIGMRRRLPANQPSLRHTYRQYSRSSILSSDNSDEEGKEKEREEGEPKEREFRSRSRSSSDLGQRWVSHRTHRREELGVDHIFVRYTAGCDALTPELQEQQRGVRSGSGVCTYSSLEVADSSVLPIEETCVAWCNSFVISDHRPVRATICLPAV